MNKKVRKVNIVEIKKIQELEKKYNMDCHKLNKNYIKKIQKIKVKARRNADEATMEKLQLAALIAIIILSIGVLKYIDDKYYDGKMTHDAYQGNVTELFPTKRDKEEIYKEYSKIDNEITEKHKGGK